MEAAGTGERRRGFVSEALTTCGNRYLSKVGTSPAEAGGGWGALPAGHRSGCGGTGRRDWEWAEGGWRGSQSGRGAACRERAGGGGGRAARRARGGGGTVLAGSWKVELSVRGAGLGSAASGPCGGGGGAAAPSTVAATFGCRSGAAPSAEADLALESCGAPEESLGRAMEGAGQEPCSRQPRAGGRERRDLAFGGFLNQARINQEPKVDRPTVEPQVAGMNKREERGIKVVKHMRRPENPDMSKKMRVEEGGGQAQERARGLRNRQENEGRGRRLQPQENPHFYQKPAPGGAQLSAQPQQVRRIGDKFLETLLQKDPSEVVITLASRSGLKELLSKPSFFQLVCQVLQKACSSMDRQSVQQLLGVVKESNFLKISLPQYVSDMITEAVPAVRHEHPVHISNIILLLQDLISVFPASSVQKISVLLTVLPTSINALRASGVDITEETEKNLNKVQMLLQHLQEKRREGMLRADNYTLMQPQTDGQEETYHTIMIYPTYNEVHRDEKPFLHPNIVSGRYESTSIYLDTHFRLLREDFVRPVREGILELLQSFEDKGLRKKIDDIRIYFDTRIDCSPIDTQNIFILQKHGMVCVGGRSSSEVLKQFTLRELRKKGELRYNLPIHLRRAYVNITSEMKQAEQELYEGAKHLECTTYGVLHERYLEACIAPQHWDSLMKGLDDKEFYYSASQHSMILEWLGLGVTVFTQNAAAENIGAENPGGQQEREEEWEGEAEEELWEIPEEAVLIQADSEDEEAAKPQGRKEEEHRAVHELASVLLAMKLEGQEEETAQPQQKTTQWEITAVQRKKMKQKMKTELHKLSAMTELEAKAIHNLQLDLSSRWRLYRLWLPAYQGLIQRRILQHEQQYQAAAERLTELRLQEDLSILKEAQVVGMTTTGAAKYRQILQKVEPQIVIVEEAAEVLEAHTITTLSKACQHLILIGDHQQLHPSANVYDLAKNFNLEVSLFERLVSVDFPFVHLKYQHCMRPEIAQLLSPHDNQELEDYPSVVKYENIKGVLANLLFVEHDFPEQEIQEGKSHHNPHEAQFVVELCKYFLCQDYLPSQITILTTYTGQLFCLRKLMPAETFAGVRVHVVDKYQGEENDIILLSLVRSNKEGRTGFLQIPNWICVALSRAKKGLYCIGNMRMLGKVPLWSKIIHTLERRHIGCSFALCCQNHPETKTLVSTAADFSEVPEGGCSRPCEFRLSCGHVCMRACHPHDTQHKEYQCLKPCQKVLCADGHCCPRSCYEPCGPCMVIVEKTISKCGHLQMVPCSAPDSEFLCQELCRKKLNCGHTCNKFCGQECTKRCPELVSMLKCGHNQKVCWITEEMKHEKSVDCNTKCSVTLECGHVRSGSCHTCFEGRFHKPCNSLCKRFLVCSHKCQQPCTTECPPCQLECQNHCVHSRCKKKCGESCFPCAEPCEWQRQHYQCTSLCSEPCNRPRCNVPYANLLCCGHPCIGLCGEPCPKKCLVCDHEELIQIFFGFEEDPDARFVQLEDCGHVFKSQGLDHYMNEDDDVIKLKVCPICQTPIRKNLRYGTIVKRWLDEREKVEEKIQGPAQEIESSRQRLQAALTGNAVLQRNLPLKYLMLEDKLKASALSTKSIGLIENQLNFYKRVADLMNSMSKIDENERRGLRKRLDEVQDWLDKPRLSFTGQELSDLQSEIQRLTYLVSLLARCKGSGEMTDSVLAAEIVSAREILEGTKKCTEEDEAAVKAGLERLHSALPVSGLGISEVERALGCSRGHWFKCRNGRIYVTGECGGAMERSKCPECHTVIRGMNHTLDSTNSLASEMDGATHAAWSETANNLLNFEELHRLL
ncbi:LOW QUALITY PROTEIN: NFX1-type zinc finger-containing protein 1 [Aegotheles albertisi]